MTATTAFPTTPPATRHDTDRLHAHRSLAQTLARKFARHHDELDELSQVAFIGLWKASRRFDPARGVSFQTFAWRTISGELKRHRRDHGWMIRPGRTAHDNFLNVSGCVEQLTHELGRSPTIAEIAARSGLTEEAVIMGTEVLGRGHADSLDGLNRPGGEPAPQLAAPDPGFDRTADRAELGQLLSVLTDAEREVVVLRFYGDMTQSAIGARIGRSQMHVSRVLSGALAKLRAAAEPRGSRPPGHQPCAADGSGPAGLQDSGGSDPVASRRPTPTSAAGGSADEGTSVMLPLVS